MIKIIDNFFCQDMVEYIGGVIETLRYHPQNSHENHDNANFYSSSPMNYPGHNVFDFMVHKIIQSRNVMVTNIQQIYVNKYPAGIGGAGDWHQDFSEITALYYPSYWEPSWGGKTEFLESEDVEYVQNRMAFFDRQNYHRGGVHSNPNGFRYTIAFKLEGKFI